MSINFSAFSDPKNDLKEFPHPHTDDKIIIEKVNEKNTDHIVKQTHCSLSNLCCVLSVKGDIVEEKNEAMEDNKIVEKKENLVLDEKVHDEKEEVAIENKE